MHTLDGSYVRLRNTPAGEVLAIVDALNDADAVGLFSFDLDDGRSQVHIPREAIARVDVDWELSRWKRFTAWVLIKLDRWL